MNLKEKFLWITLRGYAYIAWTNWENGDTINDFNYYGAPHTSPNYSAEDVFIYKDKLYVADNYNGVYVYNNDLVFERNWFKLQISTVFVYKDEVYTGGGASNTVGAIRVYDLNGNFKREWAFYGPAPSFYNCRGIYIKDDNHLYASMDKYESGGANSYVYIYDINGNEKAKLDVPDGTGRPLAWGLELYQNELFVTDYNQCLVRVFGLDLSFKRQFGPGYHITASSPTGIAAGSKKIVANITNPASTVKKFTTTGVEDPTFISDIPNPGGLFLPTKGMQYLPIVGMG